MNERLNILLKAKNELDLNSKENEVLSHDIAMELILSLFLGYEVHMDDAVGRLVNPETDGVVIFSSRHLANEFFDNFEELFNLKEAFVNMDFFIDLSRKGEPVSVDINPLSDYYLHIDLEEFIYLDEVYCSEEFNDYWRSKSTNYLKNAVKTENNQSFLDCYNMRLKSLDDEVYEKIEKVGNAETQKQIVENALTKTHENYQEYSKIFDDELIEELANLRLFVPVFNDEATIANEYNGVIDVSESEGGFGVAHTVIDKYDYMMGFTDVNKLTQLDQLFLPGENDKNKNYYVCLKPFTFVIEFMLNYGVNGLVLNKGSEDYFLIEVDTVVEYLDPLMRVRDLEVFRCSDLALNHLNL